MNSDAIKGVLCDIGGVLYVGEHVIDGALEAIKMLKQRYPVRFITNTTQKTAQSVVRKLQEFGFAIEPHEVITALDITKRFLEKDNASAEFLLTNEAKGFFSDLEGLRKRYVVVGDAQENFNYKNLNTAFRALLDGAQLVAVAKNRYFKDSDGELSMDAGGFVAALEYASSKESLIIGKPSQAFYHLACEDMGINPNEAVMIGDDIESDILGAQKSGIEAVLVQSGKFATTDLEKGITPDAIIESIAEINTILS